MYYITYAKRFSHLTHTFSNTIFKALLTLLVCVVFQSKILAQPEIILNTTGYGFNGDADNGINVEQWEYIKKFVNNTYNGKDAGVTAVRLHIEWNQYEPTMGNYQRTKIVAAVKALTELKPGMKFALHFPFQRPGYWNDSYFSSSDIAQTKSGAFVRSEIAYTCPSIYSEYATSRFYAFVDDVLSQIKDYYPKMLYVQMGNSPAEEFAIPFIGTSSGPDPGFFEQKALDSWRRKFLPLRFPNQTQATWGSQKVNISTATQPVDGVYTSDIGKDLHRFAGWGLLKKFEGFYKIVKSHDPSIKVLYFVSDFGSQQGNLSHLHNSTLPLALEYADGIYTSDGTTRYDLWKKIAAIDVLKGTDPTKIAAIEFDPEDFGETRGGSTIDGTLPSEWLPRAYKHGADYVHLAMHYSDQEISQMSDFIYQIKSQFINTNYQPPAREEAVSVNIFPNVFTSQFLFQSWTDAGGANWSTTDLKPKSLKMYDDGYWDNVWDNTTDLLPCTFTIQANASDAKPNVSTKTTLSVACEGSECGTANFIWNGEGVVNQIGSSVEITSPDVSGEFVYTVRTNRDGCASKTSTTTLAITNPLPVTLVNFAAAKSENIAKLNWSTSSETNSDRFEIQRSSDGKTWTDIGTVQSNGDVNESLSRYTFDDIEPLSGENLYRLKMVDRDGTFGYSRIRSVIFDTITSFAIYPNPAVDKLIISTNDWTKIKSVQILNISGNVVKETNNEMGPEINVDALTPGSYILRLLHTTGAQETQKFVKKG